MTDYNQAIDDFLSNEKTQDIADPVPIQDSVTDTQNPFNDAIDRFLSEQETQQKLESKSNAYLATQEDRQRAININKLARQNDVNYQAAKVAETDLQQKNKQDQYLKNLDKVKNDAPKLYNKLNTPEKIAIASDDIDNLSLFERLSKSYEQSSQAGTDNLRLARIAEKQFLGQELSAIERNDLLLIQSRQNKAKDYDINWVLGIPEAIAENIPLMVDPFLSKEAFSGAGIGAGVGAGAGAAAGGGGAIPGAIGGGIVGYVSGRNVRIARNETALAFAEFQNFTDEDGNKIDANTARAGAVVSGLISTGLESVGLKALSKTVPQAGEFVDKFTKKSVKKAFKNKTVRSYMKRFGDVVQASLTEGGTEYLQSLSQSIIGEISKAFSSGNFDAFTSQDDPQAGFWGWLAETSEKAFEEGKRGAQGGAGFASVGVAISSGIDKAQRKIQARQEQKQLEKAVDNASNSSVAKDDPDLFLELTDNPDNNAYMSPQEVKEYFQDKPEQYALFQEKIPELQEQINEAIETGGDLVLPANKVALTLADIGIKDMVKIMRLTPEAITDTDAIALINESDFIDVYNDETNKSVEYRQTIKDQLMNSGFIPDTAQSYTDALMAFYDTQYVRTDKSPEARKKLNEYYENLIIRNVTNAEQTKNLDELDLLIERAKLYKGKQGKFKQRPLQAYFKQMGGIKSDASFASDLQSLGINKKSGVFKSNSDFRYDAIPVSEFQDQFQVVGVPDDGQGYVPTDFLSEIAEQELNGIDWRDDYRADNKPLKEAKNILDLLERADIDINTASPEQVRQVLGDFKGGDNLSPPSTLEPQIDTVKIKKEVKKLENELQLKFDNNFTPTPTPPVSDPTPETSAPEPVVTEASPPENLDTQDPDNYVDLDKPDEKIEDFGEKIEGARKDLFATYTKKLNDDIDDPKKVTLSKDFPEPDYLKFIDAGISLQGVATVKALRDAIPSKPRVAHKQKRWLEQFKQARELSFSILENKISDNSLNAAIEKQRSNSELKHTIELYIALGYPAFIEAKGHTVLDGVKSFKNGVESVSTRIIKDGRFYDEKYNNYDQAVNALREKLLIDKATPKTKTKKPVDIGVFQNTKTKRIYIAKKEGAGKFIELQEGFETSKDAHKFIKENRASLEELYYKKKEIPKMRRDDERERVGQDWRIGEKMTPSKFMSEFGFKGVQFGNYVEQARRQKDLNNAYDAFLDMANILDIPAEAISLNGNLSLAFGARGKGGKGAASAHYEAGQQVINLTKRTGAGSLGHEWFHAMDNFFGEKNQGEFLTETPITRKFDKKTKSEIDPPVRPELVATFKELMQVIAKSDFKERSIKLDKKRSKDYYSTDIEMAARAFEVYLIEKARQKGDLNDYLANIVEPEVFNIMKNIENKGIGNDNPIENMYPYPTDKDLVNIVAAFDKMFDVMESRKTDKGIELFQEIQNNFDPADGTPYTEKTITIDGKKRSAVNSNGQQIAQTKEGLENFYKWFGDSKVVDDEGKPLVVYHGTRNDFEAFDKDKIGSGGSYADKGFFFSDSKLNAQTYSRKQEVLEVYLSIQNTISADAEGRLWKNISGDHGWYNEKYKKYVTMESFGSFDALPDYILDASIEDILSGKQTKDHNDFKIKIANEHKIITKFSDVADLYKREEYTENAKNKLKALKEKAESLGYKVVDGWIAQKKVGKGKNANLEEDVYIFTEASNDTPRSMNDYVDEAIEKNKDGVIIKNVIDSSIGETRPQTTIVAFDPTQIKSTSNRGTFDPQDARILYQDKETVKRGSFIKTPRGNISIINVFKDRDLSTILHETGHFYLEILRDLATSPDAPQEIRDDWHELKSWLELEGNDINTEAHENFARGFEAYLMEGKAPSQLLLDVFRKFKSWLTNIYKKVTALDVTLNDDVRGIFDRMLATDFEINNLQTKNLFRPDPEILKMLTKAEQDAYIKQNEKALEETKEKVISDNLKVYKKQQAKILKEEKAELEQDARQRIYNEPIHKMRYFLEKGKMPLDKQQEIIGAGKLDRDTIEREYGAEYVKLIPSKYLSKDGVTPALMADLFGFGDDGQMLNALVNAPNTEQEIKRSVQEDIKNRYGDPVNDGSIERDALDASYDDMREKNINYEYQVIKRKTDTVTVGKKQLEQRAKEIVADTKVGEIIAPHKYYRAEVRAAAEAQKHLAKKNYEQAAKAKQRQLLNYYLYREARNARKFTDKTLKRFKKYQKRPKAGKVTIDESYRQKAVELINAFDFGSKKKSKDTLKTLQQWQNEKSEEDASTFFDVDPELQAYSDKEHFRDMSYQDFYSLVETVENIISQGRLNRSIEIEGQKKEIAEIADELTQQVQDNFETANVPFEPRARLEQVKITAKEAFYSVIKARTLFRDLDNFKEDGLFYKYFLNPINKASNKMIRRQQDAAYKLNEIFDKHYEGRLSGELNKKTFIQSLEKSITKQAMLSYALNYGAVENRDRLLAENNLTESQLNEILGQLDKKDWVFVQDVWNFLEGFKDDIWALEKKRNGIEPQEVEKVGFQITTKDGATMQLDGGYYPIKYEEEKSAQVTKETLDDLKNTMSRSAQTKRGHTKARSKKVNKPLRNDLGVLFSHVTQVVHDLEMGDVLQNAYKILKKHNVSSAIVNAKGRQVYDQLEMWIQDQAIGGSLGTQGMETMVDGLRSGVSVATMGLKASTVLVQITGITQTMSVIGSKHALKGMWTVFGNGNPAFMKDAFKFAYAKSDILSERGETFNRDIFDAMRSMQTGGKFKNKMTQIAFYPMIKMQSVVDVMAWHGAYQKGLDTLGGDEAKAIEYADDVVVRSQGSGALKDLSAIERGTISTNNRLNKFVKLFTVYYSYFNTKLNIAYEKTKQTDFKNPSDVLNFATDFMLLFTLEYALGALILGQLPDEDEDYASWLLKGTMSNIAGQFPLLREISSQAQGFDAAPAGLRGLGDIGKAGVGLFDAGVSAFDEDEDVNVNKLLRDLNMAGGIVFKYPASQINQTLRAMGKASEGKDVAPSEYLLYKK